MIRRVRNEHITIIAWMAIGLMVGIFCSIRIYQTSVWLQQHRAYIQERDQRWEAAIKHLDAELDIIKGRLK